MEVKEFDVRDGGRWRYVSTDPSGNEYGFRGVTTGPLSLNPARAGMGDRAHVTHPGRSRMVQAWHSDL